MFDRNRWHFSRVVLYVFVGLAFGLVMESVRPLLEPRWFRSLVTIVAFVSIFYALGRVLNRLDARLERTHGEV